MISKIIADLPLAYMLDWRLPEENWIPEGYLGGTLIPPVCYLLAGGLWLADLVCMGMISLT